MLPLSSLLWPVEFVKRIRGNYQPIVLTTRGVFDNLRLILHAPAGSEDFEVGDTVYVWTENRRDEFVIVRKDMKHDGHVRFQLECPIVCPPIDPKGK